MGTLSQVRMGLFFAGLIFFFASVTQDRDWARYVAIGLMAVALLLRFVRRPPPAGDG